MERILVAGETIVDFLPTSAGSLSSVDTFRRRAGGAPANVAVGLARLDRTPTFWTRVGDDEFGDYLVERLLAEGLEDTLIERDPEAPTGLAFVTLDADAERSFSFYHEGTAETRFQPGRVQRNRLGGVDWVHVDCLSMDARPSRDAVIDLASRARDAGCTVSFDPNARPERWAAFDYPSSVRQGLELADVVKATPADLRAAEVGTWADEGDAGTGADDESGVDPDVDEEPGADADHGDHGDDEGRREDEDAVDVDRATDLARAVTGHGPHTALVTLGGAGAVAHATAEAPWVDEPVTATHGGYDVEAVDTTGAGDAFTAGAVAALADGDGVAEALAFANAVAAEATTATGAMTALPDREAVAAFRAGRAEGVE